MHLKSFQRPAAQMSNLVFSFGQNLGSKSLRAAFKRIEKSLEDAPAFAEGKNVKAREELPGRY
ncbi:MAG: hypothetical protein ONB46_06170 [candidate division KSB1 bacterium]|nr:hypothetical protein [candidate division KSB1 bacterium]MDZ7365288.1 hypothetical protein [candidate division KSB1 bacterium]MDZ7403155.1 hypothetical protein [candidate division KSB1 bacterium]